MIQSFTHYIGYDSSVCDVSSDLPGVTPYSIPANLRERSALVHRKGTTVCETFFPL